MRQFPKFVMYAMLAIAAAACAEKEESSDDQPSATSVSWTATIESLQAKASLQSDLSVKWSEGDAISVFSAKQNQAVEAESVDGATAVFSGEVIKAESYLALYPYTEGASSSGDNITTTLPETQTLVSGAPDPAAFIFVARSSEDAFSFKPLAAYLAITVKGDVKSLVVESPDAADRLTGKVRVNPSTGRTTVVSGGNRITLTGEPEASKTYYVAILPGMYAGVKVIGTRADGLSAELDIFSEEIQMTRGEVHSYTADFSEADWILKPPTDQSYEITSAKQMQEFVAFVPNPKEEVINLTISGAEITDELLAKVKDRVGSVIGNVVWDNVGATTTAGFFDAIDCQKGITLKNCAELSALDGLAAYKAIGGDLILENCPKLTQGFPVLESVTGSFKLSAVPLRFGADNSFAALSTIGGDMSVSNMGETFTTFAGSALSIVSGSISVTSNPALEDLSGLDRLAVIGTDVVIVDNPKVQKISDNAVGYCMIRDYLNKGVLSSNSTIRLGATDNYIDLNELPGCDGSMPGEPQSYVLNGKAEVEAFASKAISEKEIVKNLTISGADVDKGTLTRILDRVLRIEGTFTLENLTYNDNDWGPGTENFLEALTPNNVFPGSIVLRNIPNTVNPNGFVPMKEIKGDLIIENCPKFCLNWGEGSGLSNLEKVGGDFRLINVASGQWYDGTAWGSLKEVGGDMEIATGSEGFFFMNQCDITSIGGDLIIRDCPRFWGMNGLENLTYLGGNVTVTGYDKLPVKSGLVDGTDVVGICLFRDLINNGVMKSDASLYFKSKEDVTVDFSTVLSCTAVYEGDEFGGNEDFAQPDDVTGWE